MANVRMKQRNAASVVLLLVIFWLCFGSNASAWLEKGHHMVVQNALLKLPEGMPPCLKENAGVMAYLSMQPDMWKRYAKELRASEYPNHYLDLEKIDEDVTRIKLPEDRYAAIKLYLEKGEMPRGIGLLPYQMLDYCQRLEGVFREYRKDPSNQGIRHAIVHYAGVLAHYAGDTAQPLHTTIHYNGRILADGTVEYKGIHKRVDGLAINSFIEAEKCIPFLAPPEVYEDPADDIMRAILASHSLVDEVYRLEEQGRLDTPDAATKRFFHERLAAGSQLLLNLWYTAWKKSEEERP